MESPPKLMRNYNSSINQGEEDDSKEGGLDLLSSIASKALSVDGKGNSSLEVPDDGNFNKAVFKNLNLIQYKRLIGEINSKSNQTNLTSVSLNKNVLWNYKFGKVGSYTIDDRLERIHYHRRKRKSRRVSKTIIYESRKRISDTRPRVRGRFVKVNLV
jgi:hypothetical protein